MNTSKHWLMLCGWTMPVKCMDCIQPMVGLHQPWDSLTFEMGLFSLVKAILIMLSKRESLQPGVVNHVIAIGSFGSPKTPLMACSLCLNGAGTSWTQKRLVVPANSIKSTPIQLIMVGMRCGVMSPATSLFLEYIPQYYLMQWHNAQLWLTNISAILLTSLCQ
jgi:hypothetical protein